MNNTETVFLCIDCGNSRLKWGLYAPTGWLAQGALPLAAVTTANLTQHWQAELRQTPLYAIACNVADTSITQIINDALAQYGIPIHWFSVEQERCGVRNHYALHQLGADRWAALIGARQVHKGAALVVMCGTAITIDTLTPDGEFIGGIILPGLRLMHNALVQHAAKLPDISGHYQALPQNTADAMTSGALHAAAGAIERLFIPLHEEANACCLLSGGDAARLVPHLSLPLRQIEQLALEGLAAAAISLRYGAII